MTGKTFKVSVITPQRIVYEGRVSSLIAPAELGYLGVLVNHAPLITTLVPGKIILRKSLNESTILYSNGKGFLEVLDNDVTLLVDSIESST